MRSAIVLHAASFALQLVAGAASEPAPTKDVCLLQTKRMVQKTIQTAEAHRAEFEVSLLEQAAQHRTWRAETLARGRAANKSVGTLSNFIDTQKNSGASCFSRLLEAKRALDHLLTQVNSLSTQMTSHSDVLETEKKNLNVTLMTMDSVEDVYGSSIKKCEKETQDALDDLAQYRAELAEMDEIAAPATKHNLAEATVDFTTAPPEPAEPEALSLQGEPGIPQAQATALDHPSPSPEPASPPSVEPQKPAGSAPAAAAGSANPQAQQSSNLMTPAPPTDHSSSSPASSASSDSSGAPATEKVSLLDINWSNEVCLAFVQYMQKHSHHATIGGVAPDCNAQREELQLVFTKAYKEIQDLIKGAEERSKDRECYETAESVKAAEMAPLVSQREEATSKIEYSSQALTALEATVSALDERAETMRTHIDETLTPECYETSEVSEALTEVRELIMSLESCPGQADFELKVPEKTPLDVEEPDDGLMVSSSAKGPSSSISKSKCVCKTVIKNGLRQKECERDGMKVDSCGPSYKGQKKSYGSSRSSSSKCSCKSSVVDGVKKTTCIRDGKVVDSC